MNRETALAVLSAWFDRPGGVERAQRALAAAAPELLAERVRAHGIAAIALEVSGRFELPEVKVEALKDTARGEAARALLLEPALEELGAEAHKKGLPAVLVKGLALDQGAYPHPGLRAASDLDLIVRAEDRPAWDELLVALRYEHYIDVDRTWRRNDHATVDLHLCSSDLVGVIGVPDDLSPVRLDIPGIFDRAISLQALPVPVPAPEDHMVISAAHGLGVHLYERLMWLVDAAVLLPKCDVNRLVELARSTGADRLLFHALTLCRELDLADVRGDLLSRLRPARRGFVEKKLMRRLATGALPDRSEFLLALALPAPKGYKRELLRRGLLPSRRTVNYGRTGAGRGTIAHFARALRLAWLATVG